jgi:coenzyme F420-reducing hydrogenase alpha subunit
MSNEKSIHVHHLTRVEGHGDIIARIRDGKVEEVRFDIVEAPRFFEVFLRGRPYREVVHVAPRICGICSVSHKCAALKATEAALGVEVSEQTVLLRRLAFHGEVISSHILHIYFLAAPDFLGLNSVFELARTNREAVLRGMRLKQLGYDICGIVAGRHTHPVAMEVGGFSFVHSMDELLKLRKQLVAAMEDIRETARLYASFTIPRLERDTEYVALSHPDTYAFYDGEVVSSRGGRIPASQYRDAIEEYVVPTSTAKHARWKSPHYMVGALARLNTNFEQLSPMAREVADELGLRAPCANPFMNTAAQIAECAHCVEDAVAIIDRLATAGINASDESAGVQPKLGAGVGAVEAPRGILFHEYHYDEAGMCTWANQVIPTAQNLANLDADMRMAAAQVADRDEDFIQARLETLVRAYDPCISCSVHVVDTLRD